MTSIQLGFDWDLGLGHWDFVLAFTCSAATFLSPLFVLRNGDYNRHSSYNSRKWAITKEPNIAVVLAYRICPSTFTYLLSAETDTKKQVHHVKWTFRMA